MALRKAARHSLLLGPQLRQLAFAARGYATGEQQVGTQQATAAEGNSQLLPQHVTIPRMEDHPAPRFVSTLSCLWTAQLSSRVSAHTHTAPVLPAIWQLPCSTN